MKKLLMLIGIFCMPMIEPITASINHSPIIENVQQEKWEELGKVTLKSCKDGSPFYHTLEGVLYVRIIGERAFYRVKIGNKFYSVSVGRYYINGEKYNAKADSDYYFNLWYPNYK